MGLDGPQWVVQLEAAIDLSPKELLLLAFLVGSPDLDWHSERGRGAVIPQNVTVVCVNQVVKPRSQLSRRASQAMAAPLGCLARELGRGGRHIPEEVRQVPCILIVVVVIGQLWWADCLKCARINPCEARDAF